MNGTAEPPDTPGTHADPVADDPALAAVPSGALALAGLTVGLLLLAWFVLYVFAYLPRGTVS